MEGSAIFAISYFIFDLRNSRLVRFTPLPPPSLCENRPIKSIRNGFRLTHVPPEFFSTYSRHVIRNFFLDRSTDIENVRPRLKERLDFSITVENRSETKSTRLESKEKSCDRDAFSLLIFIISKRDWKIVGIYHVVSERVRDVCEDPKILSRTWSLTRLAVICTLIEQSTRVFHETVSRLREPAYLQQL